jgi:16S rRNA (guanine527-N7)-methyltransferase
MPHPPTRRPAADRSADQAAGRAASGQRDLLLSGALALGLPISEGVLAQLVRYQALLAEWGERINLTALRDPKDVIVRHFLDSLALVRALPASAELHAAGHDDRAAASLVDVGSGAGFPGVLCALLRPELRVTLVERIGKKAAFLLALRRELGLRYEVVAESAERLPNRYAIAVSRAALPLPDWIPFAARLVAPSGWIFAMTTPHEPIPSANDVTPYTDITYDVGAGAHRILGFRRS